jgi:hypothetical protein
MILNEKELLTKIFWPDTKENFLGNLVYNYTTEDLTSTQEISIARKQNSIEIFYSISPTFKPTEKNYFVQMYFDRQGEDFIVNKKKTSPEIVEDKDILITLDSIQNNIIKMNTKPQFFTTGVVNKITNKFSI